MSKVPSGKQPLQNFQESQVFSGCDLNSSSDASLNWDLFSQGAGKAFAKNPHQVHIKLLNISITFSTLNQFIVRFCIRIRHL